MTFVFDSRKAASNLRKHGVSFKEATTAFADQFSAEFHDNEHSDDEDRWILIGVSAYRRVPFVVYTERKSAVRIIGARLGTTKEREDYEENKF